jgi:hypothetical protein
MPLTIETDLRRSMPPLPAALGALLLVGCSMSEPERGPSVPLDASQLAALVAELALPTDAQVLVGAGDIARCADLRPAQATAALVEAVVEAAAAALVFTTGDHAYEQGTHAEFERCYGPTWGRFEAMTRPTPGNHDYDTEGALPYFDYFSEFDRNSEARNGGYYSYDFAGWHVIALNSLLPMDDGSPQLQWLANDLRAANAECVLAYWHHPLFSASLRSLTPWYPGRGSRQAWALLSEFGAELVLNGHEHFYERYAPQDPAGNAASVGIRQITAGTGGGELQSALLNRSNSAVRHTGVYGIVVLALEPDRYRWFFIGTDGVIHDRSEDAVACSA